MLQSVNVMIQAEPDVVNIAGNVNIANNVNNVNNVNKVNNVKIAKVSRVQS